MCSYLEEFEIHEPVVLSDHCLVSCTFSFDTVQKPVCRNDFSENDENHVNFRCVWNNNKKNAIYKTVSNNLDALSEGISS